MKTITLALLALSLSACGPSKRQVLTQVNDLLIKSRTLDCDEIHEYLDQVQAAVQADLDK